MVVLLALALAFHRAPSHIEVTVNRQEADLVTLHVSYRVGQDSRCLPRGFQGTQPCDDILLDTATFDTQITRVSPKPLLTVRQTQYGDGGHAYLELFKHIDLVGCNRRRARYRVLLRLRSPYDKVIVARSHITFWVSCSSP